MPTVSRRVRDTIFVDNVDFKRVARNFRKSAEQEPPRSLDEAMARVAMWFGYPSLHALVTESSHFDAPAVGRAPNTSFGTSPYRLHPLVATGQVHPTAQERISAEALLEALTDTLVHLTSALDIHVDVDLAWEFLDLDFLEQFVFKDARTTFGISSIPAVQALERYVRAIPGWRPERFQDHETPVGDAHRKVTSLIAVAPPGWSFGGGGTTPYERAASREAAKAP